MLYNFITENFTRRNFVADFERSAILEGKRPFCVFEPLWGLSGNVRWSS